MDIYIVHFTLYSKTGETLDDWYCVGPVFSTKEKADKWAINRCEYWKNELEAGENIEYMIRQSRVW